MLPPSFFLSFFHGGELLLLLLLLLLLPLLLLLLLRQVPSRMSPPRNSELGCRHPLIYPRMLPLSEVGCCHPPRKSDVATLLGTRMSPPSDLPSEVGCCHPLICLSFFLSFAVATSDSELGTRNSELGTRNSELGTRNSGAPEAFWSVPIFSNT
jgi:hypothetical protein